MPKSHKQKSVIWDCMLNPQKEIELLRNRLVKREAELARLRAELAAARKLCGEAAVMMVEPQNCKCQTHLHLGPCKDCVQRVRLSATLLAEAAKEGQ